MIGYIGLWKKNIVQNNTVNDINNKIGKILENNLISNLIIIAIGFIASLAISIYFYLKIVNIDKLIDGIYSNSNSNIFL